MNARIKILHLEDALADAELIHRRLKKENLHFEAMVVDNKSDYINALNTYSPDIILSDHSLPHFNSNAALDILLDLQLGIPFVLVTATVSEEFAADIVKRGAADYVLKDRPQRLPGVILKEIEKKKLETEHKKFLQELVVNESLMNDAQSLAQFGSFDADINCGIAKLSNQAFTIFGYKPGEAVPRCSLVPVSNTNHSTGKLRLAIGDSYVELASDKKNYTLIDKNGRLKFISAQFQTDRDSGGKILSAKGFLYDVTSLKQAETLLQQSEANLKTIFETTDTGYVLLSHDQHVVLFNKTAFELTRLQTGLELAIGKPAVMYLPEKQGQFFHEVISKTFNGESSMHETCFTDEKGDTKWLYTRWFPITDVNNRIHGIMVAISDVTDRKNAEIEREKISADLIIRNNALEQFAFIVSHNLRAPVANIIGMSQLLTNWATFNPEDINQFLQALVVSSKQLDSVINDLTGILRISNTRNKTPEVIYFQQLVEEVKTELRDLLYKSNAVIKTDFFAKLYVPGIKSYYYNIFYHIIRNSLQYRQPGLDAALFIKVTVFEKSFVLTFVDNGKGFDMKKIGKKIFGLYQRFDTSVEGKGVGLCIVKTLVDSLGGTITLESKPGAGTKFMLEIPLQI